MRNFQLVILAAPLDKSGSDQAPTVLKIFASARQAEVGITAATRAFVLEASEKRSEASYSSGLI